MVTFKQTILIWQLSIVTVKHNALRFTVRSVSIDVPNEVNKTKANPRALFYQHRLPTERRGLTKNGRDYVLWRKDQQTRYTNFEKHNIFLKYGKMYLGRTEWHLIGRRLWRTPFLEPYGVRAAISGRCMHVRNVVPHLQWCLRVVLRFKLKSHFGGCKGGPEPAKRLYASASVYRCALSMRRHTTMLHDEEKNQTQMEEKFVLFRLSRLLVFTLSLDVSLRPLTTIIAGGVK